MSCLRPIRHGLVDFLNVLDAQKDVFATQDAKTQSDESFATDFVTLYKALGGGWHDEANSPSAPFKSSKQ